MGQIDTSETRVGGQSRKGRNLPLPPLTSRYSMLQHWAPILRKGLIALSAGGALAVLGAVTTAPNERDLQSAALADFESQAGIAPGAEWLAPLKASASFTAPRAPVRAPDGDQATTLATCECCGGIAAVNRRPGSAPTSAATPKAAEATPKAVEATPKAAEVGVSPTIAVQAAPGVLPDGRVVLNAATVADLVTLPGIGPKRASQIVELRLRLGKFRKVSDLLRVKGIGVKSLRKLAPRVVLEP